MKKIIINRVDALRNIGIKKVFLINHHGGLGQFDLIKAVGEELSDENMKVEGIQTTFNMSLTEKDGYYGIGGHAGYSETTWLMAFRPELIDLSQQKEGELIVRQVGILHNKPIIEEKWNPRNVSVIVSQTLKENVVSNIVEHVRKS